VTLTSHQTDPREIDIESSTSPLVITWEDVHRSEYGLEYLRRICPCAVCTQHGATSWNERLGRVVAGRAIEVKAIRETGSYALNVGWGDGHDAGIYSFRFLREMCPCPVCQQHEGEWQV